MREIQALHSRQKEEIDSLFTRLGKVNYLSENIYYIKMHVILNATLHAYICFVMVAGPSSCGHSSSSSLDWQKETTNQKQVIQIVQNQLHARQQESVTAR